MTGMDELIAWLRQQLDADERDAPRVHDQDTCDNAIARGRDACTCGWPDRLLAEVEAKRALLEEAIRPYLGAETTAGRVAVVALRLLARPYAGRDGWREEWAT